MKRFILLMLLGIVTTISKAQDIDGLFAAGVENAERFANDYLMPGTNGLMYSMNANWFNTADVKPLGGFEISIVANASISNNEHKIFLMDLDLYETEDFSVEFVDNPSERTRMVATALGENDPNIQIDISDNNNPLLTERITLPSGIGDATANLLPTAFIQGAIGLSKGFELKARFVPKVKTDEVDISMYGAGLQIEFTKWLPADKILPVAISGLLAYTNLDATYNLTDTFEIDGDNQRIESNTNTWLLQLVASTKLPVINFYGGLGYIKGESKSDILGTYTVTGGPFIANTYTDPFSVSSEVSSVRGTIGAKLKLGFFRFNAEYHLSEFNAFSLGLNFGFR
ncbi:DUF6588 family protein [Aestuariivivens marinum]|uniref:DUF6588 family protein n=1 Tax=Aestuariivivens marinum TaxID=2913555 RepID=UPI001F59B9F1|nr:DUF6588 family protein [Aestuariivivens marinum]